MRLSAFSQRVAKELLRDPLNLAFAFGFPLVLLLLLSAIQANIPVSLFEISHLAPGIAVFGLSFLTLFSATLISKDRTSAFHARLYTTPMRAHEFILGYTLPLLPLALMQGAACYALALCLGLEFSLGLACALPALLPVSLLYVALGLFFGSLLNDRQVGGVCGALLTNLSAWLSGIWFDLSLVGGTFQKIADLLPFSHAVELSRAALKCDLAAALPHLFWVLGYALVLLSLAVFAFLRQMRRN